MLIIYTILPFVNGILLPISWYPYIFWYPDPDYPTNDKSLLSTTKRFTAQGKRDLFKVTVGISITTLARTKINFPFFSRGVVRKSHPDRKRARRFLERRAYIWNTMRQQKDVVRLAQKERVLCGGQLFESAATRSGGGSLGCREKTFALRKSIVSVKSRVAKQILLEVFPARTKVGAGRFLRKFGCFCDETLFVIKSYLWENCICDKMVFVMKHQLWGNTISNETLFAVLGILYSWRPGHNDELINWVISMQSLFHTNTKTVLASPKILYILSVRREIIPDPVRTMSTLF